MAAEVIQSKKQTLATASARPTAVLSGPLAHGLDATGTTLRIAKVHVPLSNIVSYSVDGLAEKDFASTFATAGLFGGGAAVFLLSVFVFKWSQRFILGAFLLGLIALFALIDLKRIKWVTTYTFTLLLTDGTKRTFATTSEPDALRLRDALDAQLSIAPR